MSEIKQINAGVAELLAVKVPEGIKTFAVELDALFCHKEKNVFTVVRLPKDNWTPLGLSTELTEEQCREVVHRSTINSVFYYSYVCSGYLYFNESAKLVFDNIIKSYNITERTWLILKRLS